MTDFVRRFLSAHAAVTGGTESREVPDLFVGTAAIIGELDDTIQLSRVQLTELAVARMGRSLEGMQRAHTEVDKLLRQATLLSESLIRVLQFHVERRKAQS